MMKSLTLEQVVTLLPELSWNQVFKTIDELSRRGKSSCCDEALTTKRTGVSQAACRPCIGW